MFTVRAPNTAHNGISAGVRFTAGVGQTDNPAALAYFRRAGYTIELAGSSPIPIPATPVSDPAPGGDWTAMPRADLVQLAKSLGLKGSGTSNDLIDRIRAKRAAPAPAAAAPAAPADADPFAPGREG